eukprot:scaffold5105_cov36-Phaeocystis_antarctica.AAC.1
MRAELAGVRGVREAHCAGRDDDPGGLEVGAHGRGMRARRGGASPGPSEGGAARERSEAERAGHQHRSCAGQLDGGSHRRQEGKGVREHLQPRPARRVQGLHGGQVRAHARQALLRYVREGAAPGVRSAVAHGHSGQDALLCLSDGRDVSLTAGGTDGGGHVLEAIDRPGPPQHRAAADRLPELEVGARSEHDQARGPRGELLRDARMAGRVGARQPTGVFPHLGDGVLQGYPSARSDENGDGEDDAAKDEGAQPDEVAAQDDWHLGAAQGDARGHGRPRGHSFPGGARDFHYGSRGD